MYMYIIVNVLMTSTFKARLTHLKVFLNNEWNFLLWSVNFYNEHLDVTEFTGHYDVTYYGPLRHFDVNLDNIYGSLKTK